MILNPNTDLIKIDAYPDVDVAGMYGHELSTDPTCLKRRTGFIIKFANCPAMWVSKLQTETVLSTMKAKTNDDLAHCCRELFPIIEISKAVGKAD